jgi:hypothetical protein
VAKQVAAIWGCSSDQMVDWNSSAAAGNRSIKGTRSSTATSQASMVMRFHSAASSLREENTGTRDPHPCYPQSTTSRTRKPSVAGAGPAVRTIETSH